MQLGTIHKWRHPKIRIFWPPSLPLSPYVTFGTITLQGDITPSQTPLPLLSICISNYSSQNHKLHFFWRFFHIVYIHQTIWQKVSKVGLQKDWFLYHFLKKLQNLNYDCNFCSKIAALGWHHLCWKWGPSPCHLLSPFGGPPTLPLWGDIIYGWSLSASSFNRLLE